MTLPFTALVEQLMLATGCDRAKAEAVARQNGHQPPAPPAEDRNASILEKQEQAYVVRLFREFGFDVWSLSQPRASKQTPGLPDLLVTNSELRLATFWETKRQVGGRFSEHQRRFAASCAATELPYASGDRRDAQRWLIQRGLARVLNGVLEPVRKCHG